jgi:hypothetical protein
VALEALFECDPLPPQDEGTAIHQAMAVVTDTDPDRHAQAAAPAGSSMGE